jgi:hypothetical protein
VQKITSDITDTFDPENPAQSDLLKELTLGRLIAARYLVAGRVFIVNAPAPLARAIHHRGASIASRLDQLAAPFSEEG